MSSTMKHDLYLKKEGMTRIFRDDKFIPVTVLSFPKTTILEKLEGKVKILVEWKGMFKKPQSKALGNLSIKKGFIKEVNTYRDDLEIECELNKIISKGEFVDVRARNKGKGFAGPMKRWNFKGLRASHGTSLTHRSGGSTGMRQDPGKTYKGRKMAGHLGHENVTQQNLEVMDVIEEHGIVLLKGSVPGPRKSILLVKKAVKK
jgi:large subunit ribosomal protein L3